MTDEKVRGTPLRFQTKGQPDAAVRPDYLRVTFSAYLETTEDDGCWTVSDPGAGEDW